MTQKITFEALLAKIKDSHLHSHGDRVIVAISGFGGSGKSTLARNLKEALGNAEIISIDSFVTDHLSKRSSDWEGFDFTRFKKEVVEPAHNREPVRYGVYEWESNQISHTETLELPAFLILEGCGIFQKDLMNYYDISVWIDVDLETATKQGIARDRANGAFWDEKWLEIWTPNDKDFFEKYRPDKLADFTFKP